jgi:hypothetical protein
VEYSRAKVIWTSTTGFYVTVMHMNRCRMAVEYPVSQSIEHNFLSTDP